MISLAADSLFSLLPGPALHFRPGSARALRFRGERHPARGEWFTRV